MINLSEAPMPSLYDAAVEFATDSENCSDLSSMSLSLKLGVVGRFMCPLNSDTGHLIGMPSEFSEKLTGLDTIDSGFVTILVSPPLTGPFSDYPMWHVYAISSENEICHKIPQIPNSNN